MSNLNFEDARLELRERIFAAEITAEFFMTLFDILNRYVGKKPPKDLAVIVKGSLFNNSDWPESKFHSSHIVISDHTLSLSVHRHPLPMISAKIELPKRGIKITDADIDKIKKWANSYEESARFSLQALANLRKLVDGINHHTDHLRKFLKQLGYLDTLSNGLRDIY